MTPARLAYFASTLESGCGLSTDELFELLEAAEDSPRLDYLIEHCTEEATNEDDDGELVNEFWLAFWTPIEPSGDVRVGIDDAIAALAGSH